MKIKKRRRRQTAKAVIPTYKERKNKAFDLTTCHYYITQSRNMFHHEKDDDNNQIETYPNTYNNL